MPSSWLIFVDTNILLDFYRLRGSSAIKQLSILEENRSRLILTEQIEMEFLKHRQRVVAETLNEIKKPPEQKLPAFLDQYQPSLMMKKSMAEAVAQYRKVQEKVEKIITNPSSNDQVYQSLQRVFKHRGPYSLHRDSEEKLRLRGAARKRFSLGYPPRKKDDLSMGDALNWEWIVHCAQKCPNRSNVIIVSRDGDYGVQRGNGSVVNEWLKKEFQDRVSKKRKIDLTELLTHAFKKIEVPVSREEEKEEREVASDSRRHIISVPKTIFSNEELGGKLEEVNRRLREVLNTDQKELEGFRSLSDFFRAEYKLGGDK